MIQAPLSEKEEDRLNDLLQLKILDTDPEKDFDDLVYLASMICETPISLVSLIDNKRQWFKARVGIDAQETSKDIAFCAHAILGEDLFQIEDATQDERFFDNPLVTDGPKIRFYAGIPLTTKNGHNLGTLCVIDSKPRKLTSEQEKALKILTHQAMNLMEMRLTNLRQNEFLHLLNEQRKSLEIKNNIHTRLINILTHDLRNPLNTLHSSVELILEGMLTQEEQKHFLTEINSNVESLIKLMEDMLQWGSKQIKNYTSKPEWFAPHEMVEQIFKISKLSANTKNIELKNKIPQEVTLKNVKEKVEFILRNLLQNAVKFTMNGSISIEYKENDDQILISVIDTGTGMTKPQIDKILGENQSFDSALGSMGEKGTGIGLFISKEFAQRIGAQLDIKSELGKGSTFTLAMPKVL